MDRQLPTRAAGPILGLLGSLVGFTLHGVDGAVLWFVVAYFVGKSAESLLLTMQGGPAQ